MSFWFMRSWLFWALIVIADLLAFLILRSESFPTVLLTVLLGNSFGMLITALYYGMVKRLEMRRWRI